MLSTLNNKGFQTERDCLMKNTVLGQTSKHTTTTKRSKRQTCHSNPRAKAQQSDKSTDFWIGKFFQNVSEIYLRHKSR